MKRVLVVDDQPIIRQLIRALLHQYDCEVREAADGAEAVEIAESWLPHTIVLDITVQRLDGVALARAIRTHSDERLRGCRIIVFAANDRSPEVRSLAAEGVIDALLPESSDGRTIVAAIIGEAEAALRDETAPQRVVALAEYSLEASKNQIEAHRLARERELLLQSVAEGILGVDDDGFITFINRAAAAILGHPSAQVPGARAHDLFHTSDQAVHPLTTRQCPICATVSAGAEARVPQATFWRSDHCPIEVEYVAAPIIDEGEIRGAVVVFSDLTERNRLERRIEQSNRVASLGRVAATIAHEFNNVLMGIQPFAEIVRRSSVGNQRLLSAADHITRAVQRGKGISSEILRFTRPVTPTMKPVEAVHALQDLVEELNASLPPTCRVVLDAPDRPVSVLADWPQLEQVISNLVLNAKDAMDGKGVVTLSVDDRARNGAKAKVRDPEKYIHFKCTDTGAGMPPEVLERVFEPLFTTKKTGTGLGLAVAQQVITSHGGEIWVESKPGEGTTFHVLIPRPSSS